jgi:hypothetical protein
MSQTNYNFTVLLTFSWLLQIDHSRSFWRPEIYYCGARNNLAATATRGQRQNTPANHLASKTPAIRGMLQFGDKVAEGSNKFSRYTYFHRTAA